MVDVTCIDLSTLCLGSRVSFPCGIAPAAGHGLAHPDAEEGTGRAAAGKEVAMCLSTWSNSSLEAVAAATVGRVPLAQQLSLVKDEDTNLQLIGRAEAAGYRALFVTVDCVYLGKRVNEQRNGFSYPGHLKWGNLPRFNPAGSLETAVGWMEYKTKGGWETVRWLKGVTSMEVWLKVGPGKRLVLR